MNLTLQIVLFGLIAAGAVFLGGGLVALRREWPKRIQEYLLALGAGFLLSLVIIDLIPEAIEGIGGIAPLWILIGFSALHFAEHTFVRHLHFGEETHKVGVVSSVASHSAFWGMFIHSFFDGLSISAGLQYNYALGVMIFFGILLHKFPEGLTIASIMLAADQPRKNVLWASGGIALGTMLGIVSIFFLNNVDGNITGYAFAFSAGAGMYVGASDLIPEINRSENRITPVIVFVGMVLFYASSLMVNKALGL
ncbi:MAG: ZIP family metal transporter [Ignavibacteriales bacterium]|nr:ZIP family metal transporter [Ignavibacteriales bacterium]